MASLGLIIDSGKEKLNILNGLSQVTDILAKEGINARLLDMHTIKPIDEQSIIKAAEETEAIITV